MISQASLALAFAAGTLAAVNPCGFALLPAYLTLFVSGGTSPGEGSGHPLRRAGVATAAMTAGFGLVFGAFALVVSPFALSIERWLPWVTMVMGGALLALGGWMLTGRQIMVTLPKVGGRRDPTASGWGMAAYGVSFAVASLSCTIGPFLAVTTAAFREGSAIGVASVFVAYVAGMGAVVGVLTLAVAVSRQALLRRVRSALPYLTRASGGLLILAGAYATYYGWYEVRLLRGERVDDPVIDTAARWQGELSRVVADLDAGVLAASVVVLAAVTWAGHRWARAGVRGSPSLLANSNDTGSNDSGGLNGSPEPSSVAPGSAGLAYAGRGADVVPARSDAAHGDSDLTGGGDDPVPGQPGGDPGRR